ATLVASVIAAVELVGLIVCGAVIVAKPLAHAVKRRAETHAVHKPPAVPPAPLRKEIARQHASAPKPTRSRSQTKVLVLNGNGLTGAAHSAAGKLEALGYTVTGAADAR